MGAVGLVVNRLADTDDFFVGENTPHPTFPGRHFRPVTRPFWPPFGRTARYLAGAIETLRILNPSQIEIHNRASFVPALARAFPNARLALFIHNEPQAMRGAKTAAQRATLLHQATVVCVSTYLARRFMEGVHSPTEPAILHNAVDLSALPPRADPREPTLLFAGRIVADKGADAFVRACATVLPTRLAWRAEMIGADRFWPGSRPTPFQNALAPQAAAAGIVMRGYMPHAEVLKAMAQAAIVVVPSRWAEPFGLTALEAMASGAALICSRRGGLPEVAGQAALYADPDEPGALEAAMTRLMDDAALRARMAVLGLERAPLFDATRARARLLALRCISNMPN